MNRNRIILLIVVILGVGATVFAYFQLRDRVVEVVEMKNVVVLNKEIKAYETIKPTDVKVVKIEKNVDTSNYLTDKADLIGKIAVDTLIADELVLPHFVTDKEKLSPYVFVTIKTEYSRTGGAKLGDSVDVYKVTRTDEDGNSQVSKIAENAIVINLTNKDGLLIGEKNTKASDLPLASSEDSKISIETVKLAIDNRKVDINKIVEGSTSENGTNYEFVLVVKNIPGDSILGGK